MDRTLQRRITDEGSSYRQLLFDARHELARFYLKEPSLSVSEIAYLLSYEDPSSFFRAFHEWEGTTPSEWKTAPPSSRQMRDQGMNVFNPPISEDTFNSHGKSHLRQDERPQPAQKLSQTRHGVISQVTSNLPSIHQTSEAYRLI